MIPRLGQGPLPGDVSFDIADMVIRGREFNVGRKRFRVTRVSRGSMSHVYGNVIPRIQETSKGWRLGLYADPQVDPNSHLLVACDLQRVR
mgnify:CR=1 FL=1